MTTIERPSVVPLLRVSDHLPARESVVEDPVATERARRRASRRRWRARTIVAIVLAACVATGIVQGQARLERRDRVALDGAVLAADPVDVISTSAGNVVEALVRPGVQVAAGEAVATVDAVRPAPAGGEQRVRTTLVAPVDGVVSAVPARGGAAVRSGDIVVRLYRPETLRLDIEVPLDRTTDLEIGMTGRFDARGIDPIDVVLVGIEPSLRPGVDGNPAARLEIQPTDVDAVRPLLVGLPFDGWLDKGSAPVEGA